MSATPPPPFFHLACPYFQMTYKSVVDGGIQLGASEERYCLCSRAAARRWRGRASHPTCAGAALRASFDARRAIETALRLTLLTLVKNCRFQGSGGGSGGSGGGGGDGQLIAQAQAQIPIGGYPPFSKPLASCGCGSGMRHAKLCRARRVRGDAVVAGEGAGASRTCHDEGSRRGSRSEDSTEEAGGAGGAQPLANRGDWCNAIRVCLTGLTGRAGVGLVQYPTNTTGGLTSWLCAAAAAHALSYHIHLFRRLVSERRVSGQSVGTALTRHGTSISTPSSSP